MVTYATTKTWSGGVEFEAADNLWRRFLDHGFRYMTMVSDGDDRTFKHITEREVSPS